MTTSSGNLADGNERALQYVISTVNGLCDEYSKAAHANNMAQLTHLQLSTAQVLDELEMPSVEHAKQEVALLAQLHSSLSRLIKRSEKVLESPEMVERLNKFRQETQKLLEISPDGPEKTQEKETGIEVVHGPTAGPGHQPQDQSSSLKRTKAELETQALRKLLQVEEAVGDSSSDTDAIRTPTLGSSRDPPEERSLCMIEDTIGPGATKVRMPTENESTAEAQVNAQPARVDEIKESNARKRKLKLSSVAQSKEGIHLGQTVQAGEEVTSEPSSFKWKLIIGVTVVALSFVLCSALLRAASTSVQPSHPPRGGHLENAVVKTWQMACNGMNAACKKYGLLCTKYCASGLQIDTWRRSR